MSTDPEVSPTPDPALGEQAQIAAWKVILDAAMNVGEDDPPQTFEYDELPPRDVDGNELPIPPRHVQLTVSENTGSPIRMSGHRPLLGWWLTTRLVATSSQEVRWMRGRLRVAVQDQRQQLLESTAVRVDDDGVLEPGEDGSCSQLVVWKYAAPNR